MQQFLAETDRGRIDGFRGITSKNSPPDLVTATNFNTPQQWVSQDGLNQLTETYFLDKNNDGVFEDVPDLIIIMLGTVSSRALGTGPAPPASPSQVEGARHFSPLAIPADAYKPVTISHPLHTILWLICWPSCAKWVPAQISYGLAPRLMSQVVLDLDLLKEP